MIGEILALVFAEGVDVTAGSPAPSGLSKNVSVVFTAESTKSVDISSHGINANNVIAQLYNSSNQLVDVDIDASSSTVLVITVGAPLTGTFQLRIIEVTA